jgi:ribulose-5-phosphate 4-epimerase/fuculose-1-phosphate aldolase
MNAHNTYSELGEPVLDDPVAERNRQLQDLALGYRLFAALRWGDIGDGHITLRDPERPDHMWLLGHGVSFDRATPADMVLVAPDGSATDESGAPARINKTAYYIHQPIHEARPDVGSAAHTHTQWGTPLAAERRIIEPITQEATVFYDDVALFDDEEVQIRSTDGGKRIAVALGEKTSIVLANHGLLTTGPTVASSVGLFVMMERVAETAMKASNAIPISAEAAAAARADLTEVDIGWNNFRWLVKRHLGVD